MSDTSLRMDRIYGWQTRIYDATRKHYLLGRDEMIEALAPPPAGRVLEVGCGTGRNLIHAARRWPNADYFGLDVSEVMLARARRTLSKADLEGVRLARADATDFDPAQTLRVSRFDRIYFSYALSMIQNWRRALDHTAAMLSPGGALFVVDFGDQRDLPAGFRVLLRRWLDFFHTEPPDELAGELARIAQARGFELKFERLLRGYAFLASLRRPA